jgi:hypothetical protein
VNISHAVIPSSRSWFRSLALGLLQAQSHDDFLDRAAAVTSEFPDTVNFFSWWLMPDRAAKLFPTEYRMEEKLALLMPSSTNAAESQHQKIYTAVGTDHPVGFGLRCLALYMEYFGRLLERVQSKYSVFLCHTL